MIRFDAQGVDLFEDFSNYIEFAPQVALEMMSKSGNEVREKQRAALTSTYTNTMTYVTNGIKHLAKSLSPLPFGHREQDNTTASPSSMASFINSYLMEESMTLIVNGKHGTFYPVMREKGEVVGVGSPIGAVGKKTHAILQRMNDDSIIDGYPTKDRLSKKNIGTHYASLGNSNAQGKVNEYLLVLYSQTLELVMQSHRKQI